jgi:hypothetical protein
MRSTYLSSQGLHILGIAMAIGASIACSPATSNTTTITAAEVETTPASTSVSAKEATPTSAPTPTASQPACRTKSAALGTAELVLTWEGGSAKGSLEHVAPSGNATSQRVHAERYKGMIVADDVAETDLVAHAAVVTEKDGKRYMRVGDDNQPWLACE